MDAIAIEVNGKTPEEFLEEFNDIAHETFPRYMLYVSEDKVKGKVDRAISILSGFLSHYAGRFPEGVVEITGDGLNILLPVITLYSNYSGKAYEYKDIYMTVYYSYNEAEVFGHALVGGVGHPHAAVPPSSGGYRGSFCTGYSPNREWSRKNWRSVMDQAIIAASTYTVGNAYRALPDDEVKCHSCERTMIILTPESPPSARRGGQACEVCGEFSCNNCQVKCQTCGRQTCRNCATLDRFCSEECATGACIVCGSNDGEMVEVRRSSSHDGYRDRWGDITMLAIHESCMTRNRSVTGNCVLCGEPTTNMPYRNSYHLLYNVFTGVERTMLTCFECGEPPETFELDGVKVRKCESGYCSPRSYHPESDFFKIGDDFLCTRNDAGVRILIEGGDNLINLKIVQEILKDDRVGVIQNEGLLRMAKYPQLIMDPVDGGEKVRMCASCGRVTMIEGKPEEGLWCCTPYCWSDAIGVIFNHASPEVLYEFLKEYYGKSLPIYIGGEEFYGKLETSVKGVGDGRVNIVLERILGRSRRSVFNTFSVYPTDVGMRSFEEPEAEGETT